MRLAYSIHPGKWYSEDRQDIIDIIGPFAGSMSVMRGDESASVVMYERGADQCMAKADKLLETYAPVH